MVSTNVTIDFYVQIDGKHAVSFFAMSTAKLLKMEKVIASAILKQIANRDFNMQRREVRKKLVSLEACARWF
jgi:hypothetical protein